MATCKISVIIPCFNYGEYLSESIKSVIDQQSGCKEIEVIVVNDYSDEKETLDVLEYWKHKDERVRVLDNTGRKGISAARNHGVRNAGGDWIAFLDADDTWLQGGLQKRWKVIDTFRQAKWIGADFIKKNVDGSLDPMGWFLSSDKARSILNFSTRVDEIILLKKPIKQFLEMSLGWTGTIIVRKDIFQKTGLFDEDLDQYEDQHLWLRLAAETDFYFIPEPVAVYRQHQRSTSRQERPPTIWFIKAIKSLIKDKRFIITHRKIMYCKLANLYSQNAYYHRRRKEKKLGLLSGVNAVRYAPLNLTHWKNMVSILIGRK